MTWLIRKQGWEGMTNLCDTRSDASYPYHELDGAKFVTSNDEGEVCFQLVDGRIAWLVSTDLEVEYPLQNDTIVEKSVIPTHNTIVEQVNYVHCVFQELEGLGVPLPMGDYNTMYEYLECARDKLLEIETPS